MADSAEVVIRLVEGPAGGPAPVSHTYPATTAPAQTAGRTGPVTSPSPADFSAPTSTAAPRGNPQQQFRRLREEVLRQIRIKQDELEQFQSMDEEAAQQLKPLNQRLLQPEAAEQLKELRSHYAGVIEDIRRETEELQAEQAAYAQAQQAYLRQGMAGQREQAKERSSVLKAQLAERKKVLEQEQKQRDEWAADYARAEEKWAEGESKMHRQRIARELSDTEKAQRNEMAGLLHKRAMGQELTPAEAQRDKELRLVSPSYRRRRERQVATARQKLNKAESRPPRTVIPVTPRGKAMLAAEKKIERERHQKRTEQYYQRYPDAKPPKKEGPGAVQLTQQLGMPGVSGIIGAAMTGNPVAIGMAAFTTAIDNAEKGVKHFGEVAASIAAGDAMGLSRSLTGLANQIPVVGGIMASAGNAILDISEGLMAQGRRISQYSAGLATQFAEYDVRQLMRDIRRANDPDIQRGVQAAMEFRDRMNDLLDKHMPEIVAVMEGGLNALLGIFKFVSQFMPAIARNTERAVPESAASDEMFVRLFDHPQAGLDRRNDMPMNQAGNQMPPGLGGL